MGDCCCAGVSHAPTRPCAPAFWGVWKERCARGKRDKEDGELAGGKGQERLLAVIMNVQQTREATIPAHPKTRRKRQGNDVNNFEIYKIDFFFRMHSHELPTKRISGKRASLVALKGLIVRMTPSA